MDPLYLPGRATYRAPKTVPDSELELIKTSLRSNDNGRFYSMFPASTPKYARNQGARSSERTESMARMYITGQGPDIRDSNLSKSVGNLFTGGVRVDGATERTGGADSPSGFGYFDFLLSTWSISYQEREQAVDTISDNTVIFYSGMSAPIGQGAGALLNTYQDDQNVWFHYAYMECLRGSRLASKGQVASLLCDSFRYDGYLTNLSVQTQAAVQNAVMFSFAFRVKQISIVTPVIYSASACVDVWTSRQPDLVVTTPTGIDDTTPTGVEAAVNPVSARSAPAAVAAADATTRDARATPESAVNPFTDTAAAAALAIGSEHTIAALAAQGDVDLAYIDPAATLNAEGVISTSGDIAPTTIPADTAPESVVSPEQQLINSISGPQDVQFGLGYVVPVDAASGRFVAVTGPGSVIDVGGSVVVSACVGADRIAAAAQLGGASPGPAYGSSTLPAYAQSGSQLPDGFADIYRVQGTVFAEAYARAASQVAVSQTVGGLLHRTVVGRRSRRIQGASPAVV